MKKVILIFVSFLLLGCPCEGPDCGPLELDVPILLKNNLSDNNFKYSLVLISNISNRYDSIIPENRIINLYKNIDDNKFKSLEQSSIDTLHYVSSFFYKIILIGVVIITSLM